MRLEYLAIDGYKGLKDLRIDFWKQRSKTAIDFLIGKNGSGKSSVLEALGLIFTRIMQNESPGFSFDLRYEMSDGTNVHVWPQGKSEKRNESSGKLHVEIRAQGEVRVLERIPGEYLPDRIISYCSGANSSMEEILVNSPREALVSDLYDQARKNVEEDSAKVREILNFYEQLDDNPRVLSLDAVTSKVVLPVLFAVLPMEIQKTHAELRKRYYSLREKITKRLEMDLVPVAFSFQVEDELLERESDIPQIDILRQLLTDTAHSRIPGADYICSGLSAEHTSDDGSPDTVSKAIFLFRTYEKNEKTSYYHPGLQHFFAGNPFTSISMLLTAFRLGIISGLHFTYRDGNNKGLYDMEALSDGELMWLARMGLVLLAQKYCGENTLFLYDEPDVHFNDDWNREFIQFLYQLSEGLHHEFLIATHSTLILTDALYEQLHLFVQTEKGRMTTDKSEISTFAAQRDEISRIVFKTEAIGAYAEESVRNMMKAKEPEELIDNIEKMGPGYQRFRMYEQLYKVMDDKQG